MNRTERLLDLLTYLLNAHEPVSWQEIKNHFPEDYAQGVEESNQRKFERDKAELISLGIPIDYFSGSDQQREGYIIEKDKLFLPEVEFTPQESSLLMLSASALQENQSFPYADQLESALHKIISIHGSFHLPSPPQDLTIQAGKSSGPQSRSRWVRQIQDALERRKTLEIQYYAFSTGKTTRRAVDPYGLVFRKGSWTLVGCDHLRKAIRNFVLTRIRNLKVNPRRPGTPDYEVPESFALSEHQHAQDWQLRLHKPIEVTIRLSRHRLPELAPQLIGARRLDDETFRLQVTNKDGLLRWVLSQKTDVVLLDPPSLGEEIKQRLGRLI